MQKPCTKRTKNHRNRAWVKKTEYQKQSPQQCMKKDRLWKEGRVCSSPFILLLGKQSFITPLLLPATPATVDFPCLQQSSRPRWCWPVSRLATVAKSRCAQMEDFWQPVERRTWCPLSLVAVAINRHKSTIAIILGVVSACVSYAWAFRADDCDYYVRLYAGEIFGTYDAHL